MISFRALLLKLNWAMLAQGTLAGLLFLEATIITIVGGLLLAGRPLLRLYRGLDRAWWSWRIRNRKARDVVRPVARREGREWESAQKGGYEMPDKVEVAPSRRTEAGSGHEAALFSVLPR